VLRRAEVGCKKWATVIVLLSGLLFSMSLLAYESGDTLLRVGYTNIDFREDSDDVLVNDQFSLGRLSVESKKSPILTVATVLNERWAVEFMLPLAPLEIKSDGHGGLIDGLPMGSADVWLASATLQYYPFDIGWANPYVGLGVNYAHIRNEKINKHTAMLLGIEQVNVEADDSIGVVMQLGVDFPVTENLMINVSSSFVDVNLDAKGTFTSNGVQSNVSANLDLKRQPNMTIIGLIYQFK